MLEIENIWVNYPPDISALQAINLSLKKGEKVALVGANGAGKSTLLFAILGMVDFKKGQITVDGIPVTKKRQKEILKKVGLVFQNPDDQLFMPSVYEDIAFGPRHFGNSQEQTDVMVTQTAKALGIEHILARESHQLSGGEKRRAALAAVLAMKPPLLLLDEPAAFLDPRARRQLIGTLQNLSVTQLIATHDLDLALDICDRVVILSRGKIAADGAANRLLTDEKLLNQCGLELPLSFQRRKD